MSVFFTFNAALEHPTRLLARREVAHRILNFVHVNCVSHLSRPGMSINALLLERLACVRRIT